MPHTFYNLFRIMAFQVGYFRHIHLYLKFVVIMEFSRLIACQSRKENPQKLTQLSSRSHPRHLVGKSRYDKL